MDKLEKYYIYAHYRLDNFTPFYIGKGKGDRAYDLRRNKHHDNIVDKYGCCVVILEENLTEEEAYNKEEQIIEELVFEEDYGIDIKDFNNYNSEDRHFLTNATWGGVNEFLTEDYGYYIKIPNKYIWNYDKNSYMKEYGNKFLGIVIYLYSMVNIQELSCFTLEDMITTLGFKTRTGKNGNNEEFKEYLINLQKEGIIYNCNKTLSNIKVNDLIKCRIKSIQDKEFFTLYLRDFEKIFGLNEKNEVKMGILNLYCYILARLKKRDKDLCPGAEGYYAEATWFSQDKAIFDLNMPKKSFTKYLKILVENDLVCYGNIGLVSKLGVTKTANNVYTIEHEELKQALSESKYYYIQEGWTILNRNKKKVTKQIEGLKGRIKQLEKEGYDTFLLREKLHELEMGLEPEDSIDK